MDLFKLSDVSNNSLDLDNDSSEQPTIGSLANGFKNNNHQKTTSKKTKRGDISSPESTNSQLSNSSKCDPILIFAKPDDPFIRVDPIEFDKKIEEITNSTISHTKLDRNKNLLIFPCSSEDSDLIMSCTNLYPSHNKFDFRN